MNQLSIVGKREEEEEEEEDKTMVSNNERPFTYGDLILIKNENNLYLTMGKDNHAQLSFQPYDETEKSQKLLVGGNEKLGDQFYLTFKYGPGFLYIDSGDSLVKNGLPWTEKTIFDVSLLKKALHLDHISFIITKE
ncbi:unnamed protein product [Cunninghamella echinulata]